MVSRVKRRLATAGLFQGIFHRNAQFLEDFHKANSDLRVKLIHQARNEKGDSHGLDGDDAFQLDKRVPAYLPENLLIIITPTSETTRVLMANGLEKEKTGYKIVQQKPHGCGQWNSNHQKEGSVMTQLKDKVAIVTGGTKGIGRAVAENLLAEGVKVVICSRHDSDVMRGMEALRRNAGERISGMCCDVREYAQVENLVQSASERYGGIDILINNAGLGIFASVADLTPEQWRQVIDTNLTGVFYCCRAAIPYMRQRGGGYIINISSLAGKNPFKGGSAYNASKFGLNGFSEAIMQDLRYDNIRVSYVMPGSVDTDFGGPGEKGDTTWRLTPGDVARVVIDLLHHDPRCLPSCVEMRPSKPPRK
jgi:3-oxoacyl-[acyl-carrier protein] reductase